MSSDRSLDITVHVTGTQAADGSYSASATYRQTCSSPPMDGVVAANGDIHLGALSGHSDYNWAIGKNFTLDATITDRNGNNVPCTWASPLSRACVITGPNERDRHGMAVSQPSAARLTIHNPNNDRHEAREVDRTYTYKLGVILPGADNYFISLDPKITNTGPAS